MAMKSGGLDWWRNRLRTVNSDIFDIIENAIMVAAADCPKEFRLRRDRIAEKLFTCRMSRCSGCDRVELSVPEDEENEGCKSGFDGDACELEVGGSKGSKVNSTRDDNDPTEMNMNQESNYSYGEAEALTDEIEEEGQVFKEVIRIKEVLQNRDDASESVLFENLRRLQLMALTVDILKATEIGKAVNGLRKHGSKDIRHLARTLIEEWKELVDAWVNATAAIAEGTPDSVNPSVVDEEEGLPSLPLDEALYFATQPTSMELSRFFDGMDDDGNPRSTGDAIKTHETVRKPSTEKQNVPKWKLQCQNEGNGLPKENKSQVLKRQEAVVKPNKPSVTESGPGRPQKVGLEQKPAPETKYFPKQETVTIQRRPVACQPDNKHPDEDAVQTKLEATKRKLHESYQQAENAKKQRTIQVMELHDLPKQGLGRNPHMRPGNPHMKPGVSHTKPGNSQMKPGNHNRHWMNGRRQENYFKF